MTANIETLTHLPYTELVKEYSEDFSVVPPLNELEIRTLARLSMPDVPVPLDSVDEHLRGEIMLAPVRASMLDEASARLNGKNKCIDVSGLETERYKTERSLKLYELLLHTRKSLTEVEPTTDSRLQYDSITLLSEQRDYVGAKSFTEDAINRYIEELALDAAGRSEVESQKIFKERVNKACWSLGTNPETWQQSVDLRSRYIMFTLQSFIDNPAPEKPWRKKIQEFHTDEFWRSVNNLTLLRMNELSASKGVIAIFPKIKLQNGANSEHTDPLFELNGKRISQTLYYNSAGTLYQVLYSGESLAESN